ncbi:MAG TPA: periplasmic heavy metal sensor [Bacteroidota bacterium]|nr:periplasmic heavy metal sensor [Bacteroidota bacterium]
MDLLGRNRVLTAGIVVLAVLNVAALGTLWWQNARIPRPRPGAYPGAPSPREFMERRLGLSEPQRARFEEMRLRYRAETEPIERNIWTVRRALYESLRRGAPPDSFVASATEELGRLEAQMQRATFRHFEGLRALCDSLQRPDLDMLLRDLFERESGVPPSPPGMMREGGGEIPPPPRPGSGPPPGLPPS